MNSSSRGKSSYFLAKYTMVEKVDLVHYSTTDKTTTTTKLHHLKCEFAIRPKLHSRMGYSIMVPCDKGSDEFPLLCNFLQYGDYEV